MSQQPNEQDKENTNSAIKTELSSTDIKQEQDQEKSNTPLIRKHNALDSQKKLDQNKHYRKLIHENYLLYSKGEQWKDTFKSNLLGHIDYSGLLPRSLNEAGSEFLVN